MTRFPTFTKLFGDHTDHDEEEHNVSDKPFPTQHGNDPDPIIDEAEELISRDKHVADETVETDELTHRIDDAIFDLNRYGWDDGFTMSQFITEYELGPYSRKLAMHLGRQLRAIGWESFPTTRGGRGVTVWREVE